MLIGECSVELGTRHVQDLDTRGFANNCLAFAVNHSESADVGLLQSA